MGANKRVVKLFYDVLSPYSYVAFEVLTRCSKKWTSMDLQLNPVLIAGVMQSTGNMPPGMLPARANYMTKDLYRISEYYGVNFKFPKNVMDIMLKKGSLKAQRLLTAVKMERPELLEKASRLLFQRIWFKGEDITEESSLKEVCKSLNITDDLAKTLVAMTMEDRAKDALKSSTAEAVQYGAFGLPAYVLEHKGKHQLMFGTDRLFLLAHYLGEEAPESKL